LDFEIPNLRPILPVIGTLGLILIVLEASLDLKLERRKKSLIINSVSSALVLFAVFVACMTLFLAEFQGYSVRDSILNAIPVGIISSAVAISSAIHIKPGDREFVIYESSFSDIIGIIIFDFILLSQGTFGQGIVDLGLKSILTVALALITTLILAILLHKINYHVSYVIIMTSIVLVYIVAKLFHLPALLLVLIFGMVLSNNHLLENNIAKKHVDFIKFRNDIKSFRTILTEFTFLVRSFFFIMFGFYSNINGLFEMVNILTAVAITAGIFFIRLLYFRLVIRTKIVPLLFFAPRGLITILLFISVPEASRITFLGEETVTLVILFTIFILMVGNFMSKSEKTPVQANDIVTGENFSH
jgi:hypothetical protein